MMFLSSRIKKVIAVVMASAIAVAGLPYDFVYANNGDESSDSDISSTGTQTEQNGKVELATGKEITSDIGYISLKADSEICSEVYANDGKNNIELPNYNLNNTDTYIAPYDFKDSLFWSFNNKDNEEVSGKSYKNYYLRIDSNDKEFGNNLTFSVSESNGTYGKNEFNFERVVEAGNSSLYKYSVLSDSEEDFDNIKNLTNGTIILKSIASGKEVYININGFKLSSFSVFLIPSSETVIILLTSSIISSCTEVLTELVSITISSFSTCTTLMSEFVTCLFSIFTSTFYLFFQAITSYLFQIKLEVNVLILYH